MGMPLVICLKMGLTNSMFHLQAPLCGGMTPTCRAAYSPELSRPRPPCRVGCRSGEAPRWAFDGAQKSGSCAGGSTSGIGRKLVGWLLCGCLRRGPGRLFCWWLDLHL
ncbi:hypothetical protein GOODEAATRI_023885 [Goodea atripinnis]|uniref:Uncharacterized protein n=1 Tax=Goodea atripinnis TaxID=208336 RepID=A0ABV0ND35_9TELE